MDTKTITLETPLPRGETKIDSLTLRKPNVGALRGVSLRALLDMEANAIATVLPRISEPCLVAAEINTMAAPDLLQTGMVIAGFFLPREALAEANASVGSLT
ncbi:MAG: hypothetical protein H6R10_2799 [Rhodocyclaceae bacterium]|nr:hypothetical protein [Rhodocyclaceae bacterium]